MIWLKATFSFKLRNFSSVIQEVRKGVTPIVSTLLLIVIVVSVSVLAYMWSYVQFEGSRQAISREVEWSERYLLEDWIIEHVDVKCLLVGGVWRISLAIYVRNVGDVPTTIEDVFVNDGLKLSNLNTKVIPGASVKLPTILIGSFSCVCDCTEAAKDIKIRIVSERGKAVEYVASIFGG